MHNDFFALFDLPASFAIDKTALKARFLALQKQHHPDNHTGTNVHQAEQNTALINHAYGVLSRDDSRAVYLLEHEGVAFNADSSISDEPFLMAMMTHRMDLEDAIFDKNTAQIHAIAQQVNELQTSTAQAFQNAFDNKDWQTAQIIAQKMKFLGNLYEDIDNALSNAVTNTTPDHDDDLYV